MTGRDLILYILENGLENEPVYKHGKFIGFITANEAAAKTNVGLATIYAWLHQGKLDGILVNEGLYIPANFKSPIKDN